MANDALKKAAELGVVKSFIAAYQQQTGESLTIVEIGEAPDFVLQTHSGARIGAEIATSYYDAAAARTLWSQLRRSPAPTTGASLNPSDRLAEEISTRLEDKWRHSHGRCLLLLHADAPLTTCAEFEGEVVPRIIFPARASPFEGVYVRMSEKNSAEVELVWWELYPRRRRFSELAPLHNQTL